MGMRRSAGRSVLDLRAKRWKRDAKPITARLCTGLSTENVNNTIAIANGSTLEVVAADGSGAQVVFDQPGDLANPSWSHDGTTIAFQRLTGGRWSIWLVSPDGTNAREAPVSAASNNVYPQWSPIDSRLAFLSDRGGRYGLYVGAAGAVGAVVCSIVAVIAALASRST